MTLNRTISNQFQVIVRYNDRLRCNNTLSRDHNAQHIYKIQAKHLIEIQQTSMCKLAKEE
jgi:hypothetical protein